MNRAVCGKTQTARFCMGMDRGKSEQHAEEVRKSDQLNRAEGSRGDSPLQGQGAAPLVGVGAMPQPLLVKTTQREQPTRRRQRSVPASNFALPQERPKLLYPSTQYCRARWARPRCLTSNRSGSLPQAEGFASAEATRGQWKQTKSAVAPLTPSGAPPCFLIF